MLTVSIVSVATGIYLDYWKNLVTSIEKHAFPQQPPLKFFLFTDQVKAANEFASTMFSECDIKVVPYAPWPEATMARYFHYEKWADEISAESGLVLHLDADMLVSSGFDTNLWNIAAKNDFTFVAHPGFWRERYRGPLRLWKSSLGDIWADARLKALRGGLGAWETSKKSAAFLPRHKRLTYVCGGVWLAKGETFKTLVSTVSRRMRIDAQSEVTAIWHDESHLNKFYSDFKNQSGVIPPSYCHSELFPDCRRLTPLISAVEKGEKRVR